MRALRPGDPTASRRSMPSYGMEQSPAMTELWSKYAPTAARRHGRPGREIRPQSTTVDIHSHVAVPSAAAFVEPHLDPAAIPLSHFADAETRALSRKQEEDIRARITGYDERLADLDAMGIDMQLVMPPPNQCYYSVPLDIAVQASRMVNDGLAEYVSRRPDRFVALGGVPLAHGGEAAAELERCVRALGMKGVEVLTNVAGKELSEPDYAPFWRKAEELGALVVIHPNGFTEGRRLTRFYFNNVIGNPLETTIALHYLIFDGVLERHPQLRILAVHGGGYLPAYCGRIDHAFVIFNYGIFPQIETSLAAEGIALMALATWWDVAQTAERLGRFAPGQYETVESFLKDPNAWSKARATARR